MKAFKLPIINCMLLICLGALSTTLKAQNIMFELPIYFEDAVGNKDTVTVGYGTGITLENRFGDTQSELVDYGTLFLDKDLDIWLMNTISDDPNINGYRSKTWYFEFGKEDCGDSSEAPILVDLAIRNVHPPLKMTWNESLLCLNNCTNESQLIDNFLFHVVNTNVALEYNLVKPLCGVNGSWEFNLGGLMRDSIVNFQTIYYEQDSLGGLDIIYLFHLGLTNAAIISSVKEVNSIDLQVYPNPALQELWINGLEGQRDISMTIVDMIGRVVFKNHIHVGSKEEKLDLFNLPSGAYVLLVSGRDGLHSAERFMKL